MQSFYLAGIHYRQEMQRCNKADCKRCPHGPYWFAYHRRGAFLRKLYVGKNLPDNVRDLLATSDNQRELFSNVELAKKRSAPNAIATKVKKRGKKRAS